MLLEEMVVAIKFLKWLFQINGSTTYASWTIPSSTITNGIFSFGGATGITYNAYTALTPVDAQSLATVALSIKPATRAVNNGPVYDVLKANGFYYHRPIWCIINYYIRT